MAAAAGSGAAALAAILAFAAPARAAGGHHSVDDATMLDPGQCQIETWWLRETGGPRTLLHAGPSCRAGAVELGFAADHVQLGDAGTTTLAGAQLKWARALSESWSAGVVLGVAGQDHAPAFLGSSVVVPVTWQAGETLLVHFNVGRDFLNQRPDTSHAGLAAEWAASAEWSFVAERFREFGGNFWRAGVRWAVTPAASIDLSRARGLDSGAVGWWTLGLNWVFDVSR